MERYYAIYTGGVEVELYAKTYEEAEKEAEEEIPIDAWDYASQDYYNTYERLLRIEERVI